MKRKGLFAAGMLATGLLATTAVAAASDMFLKMDGVTGESTDDKHPGEMEVLSWSWGESSGSAQTRQGTVPASCIRDLTFTKFIDSASPTLIMNGMTGEVAPKAVLVVRKSGGSQFEYLRLTMNNVMVTSFQTGGHQGETLLTESVTLHFESMQGRYVQQKLDGSIGQSFNFDITGGGRGCS